MTKTYTLELKFVLTDEQQEKVIEAARRLMLLVRRALHMKVKRHVSSVPKSSLKGPEVRFCT